MAEGEGSHTPLHEVPQVARRAATGHWARRIARFGHAAKGVVYLLIAALAVQAAVGAGGPKGSRGALRSLTDEPFGQVALVLIGLGLAAYGIWRFLLGTADFEHWGLKGRGGLQRFQYVAGGLLNFSAAVFAVSLVVSSLSSGPSKEGLTAWLMGYPAGPWLVGLVGAGFVGFAGYALNKAATAGFLGLQRTDDMDEVELVPFAWMGRVGIGARAVAFGLIGVFFVRAALQHDPSEAGGLGQALQTLARQPHGRWLLGGVAVGLGCYALYCFGVARYRQFDFGQGE